MLYPHLRCCHNAFQFVSVLSSATVDQVIHREDVPDARLITSDAVLHVSGHSLPSPNYSPSAERSVQHTSSMSLNSVARSMCKATPAESDLKAEGR